MDSMVGGGAVTEGQPLISFIQEVDLEALQDEATLSRSHSSSLTEQGLEPKALIPSPVLVQSKTQFAAEAPSTSCM